MLFLLELNHHRAVPHGDFDISDIFLNFTYRVMWSSFVHLFIITESVICYKPYFFGNLTGGPAPFRREQMFWNEHKPPHFHCAYGEYEYLVNIRTLEVMEGKMPRRALNLALNWAELHQAELLED